jgi:hypothetical protein
MAFPEREREREKERERERERERETEREGERKTSSVMMSRNGGPHRAGGILNTKFFA